MSFVMILVGVPGCGKSTVLQGVIRQVPELAVINMGDRMLEAAASHHIDKDSLRKLPLAEQQKFGVEAAKKIAHHLPMLACIDTHALVKTPFGYCPGVPEEVAKILKPTVIAMIECPPALILERRKKDGSRNRDQDSIEQITYHQDLSRIFSISCSVMTGALFAPIQNQNDPSEASQQLIKLVQSLKS